MTACTYKIETVTGRHPYAGTESSVCLTIEGTEGSYDTELDNGVSAFEPGQ